MVLLNSLIRDTILVFKKNHYSYLSAQEQSLTEREAMISNIKLLVRHLETERLVVERKIEIFYSERERLRELSEKALSKSIADGDIELAKIVSDFIANVYEIDLF
jgi:hypothetical protein